MITEEFELDRTDLTAEASKSFCWCSLQKRKDESSSKGQASEITSIQRSEDKFVSTNDRTDDFEHS
jgi:hypothetical protein